MTQINLLPWREQARTQKQIKFAAVLVAWIIAGFVVVLALHFYMNHLIGYQQTRNDFLKTAIENESAELMSLNKKKREIDAVTADLNFLFALRKQSYQAIRFLAELPLVVPEAIKIVSLTRENNSISITGRAKSNLQITLFMENLAKSNIFKQPELTNISGKENSSGEERIFQLKVDQRD